MKQLLTIIACASLAAAGLAQSRPLPQQIAHMEIVNGTTSSPLKTLAKSDGKLMSIECAQEDTLELYFATNYTGGAYVNFRIHAAPLSDGAVQEIQFWSYLDQAWVTFLVRTWEEDTEIAEVEVPAEGYVDTGLLLTRVLWHHGGTQKAIWIDSVQWSPVDF